MGDAAVHSTEIEKLLEALVAAAGGITLTDDVIYAVNSGAGTANAVKATATGSISTAPGAQLITVNFIAANTGAMTLAINGETPRPLVTNTGAAIEAGYVQAGMSALVQIDGAGNYRLFSYGDASAIQAAVEALLVSATAEADRAETAAGSVAPAPQWAFATKAAAALFNPAVAPQFISLTGFTTANEFGGAKQYVKNPAATHGGVVTLADGTKYEPDTTTAVTPAMYGGSLSDALTQGQHVHLMGAMDLAAAISITGKEKIRITGDFGASVKYTGAARVSNVISIEGGISSAEVSDITIDGNSTASSGLSIYSDFGLADVTVRRVVARNFRTANYSVVNAHAAGIRLQIAADAADYGGSAIVENCTVSTMLKDTQAAEPNSMANQGIVVVGFQRVDMRRNHVEGILTDDTVKVDADGIVVFSRLVGGVYLPMVGEVDFNTLKNCAGRFIKTQVDGDFVVHHNRLEFKGAIQLIRSFRGIDSQVGSCKIEDNDFVFDDQWIVGDEAFLIMGQSPSAQPTTTKQTRIAVRRNRLFTSKTLGEMITPVLNDQDDRTEWIIEDNEAVWTGAGDSPAVNIASTIRYPATSTKKFAIRYRRNNVAANNLILQVATSGAGDKTAMMELDVVDNVNRYGSNFIFATSSNCWTSDMLIRGNGGHASADRIQQASLDLSKLRSGSNFLMGTGTIIKGPQSTLDGYNVQKNGTINILAISDTAIASSRDNGTTWKLVSLT